MSTKGILASTLNCLTNPIATSRKLKHRQARLLAWMLIFLVLFSATILFILLIFNPQHDPACHQYNILISGLIVSLTFAYVLNCAGHYNISASLLVASAIITPWASLLFDSSILQGDFVPLTYLAFSVLLSSILLPTYITFALASLQFIGITLVLAISPASVSFNWVSFLSFVILISVFSILTNNIIQRDMKQIESQTRQLALNEARLQELSIRDYLTNLFNRRYLQETLEREIQRATRKRVSLGVIILDVDKFKHINDSLGHATGDTVLQELGKFIAGQIRQSDIACRYGGDEFVLVLPDTSRVTTIERAEQLKDKVKSLNLSITVTLSLGIAVFPDNGTDGETLLKSADVALYQAKHDGGNRVVVAE